ncbi:Proline-rich protein PRCC [Habropoda laboriosa]|uniref:Proline-rich protein PRCC n=1 Tax=Habropoda laboriosa TaxID=597456 RepID=A0A0L7RCD8_9HYME|nr:PREDICTED: proline-rich protein PRCC [Habropoda laboriosa]KOC68401.1 Proline-rich protein PRCC [Habropoda laboriosa]
MSLVAYGSSDESSEDEGINCEAKSENEIAPEVAIQKTNDKLCLPTPKHDTLVEKVRDIDDTETVEANDLPEKIHFDKLPKPKSLIIETETIEEDDIPPQKEIELKPEKSTKKDRAPVKITVPSLSEFKDLEEEKETKSDKIKPSNKGTKLFALLPPPKGIEVKATKNLVPSVVNKAAAKTNQVKLQPAKDAHAKDSDIKRVTKSVPLKSSIGISYDSNSEDEDDAATSTSSRSTTDFFALTATETVPDIAMSDLDSNTDLSNLDLELENNSNKDNNSGDNPDDSSDTAVTETSINSPHKTLVSNVINLPREEILLKNKAEVGPKLPVPEQEYNVDVEGNVAFDDKAIEYLCGRRGVKRKPKEIEDVNIIEINGEDIKPDEREWLVKALTEESVQRPVSMQGGGVSSQSKKKHQITYLAHQAKAMEMELKNQWAQNRLTRKQTQSKYGF